MRIRSWMMLGIGYLAGSAAGRQKFEEIRSTVREMTSSGPAAEMMDKVRSGLGLPESMSGSGNRGTDRGAGDSADGWQHEQGAWVPDSAESGSETGQRSDMTPEADRHADTTTGS